MKRKQRIEGIKKAFNLHPDSHREVRVQKLDFVSSITNIIIIIKTAWNYGIQSQESFDNRFIRSEILY